MYHSFTDVAYLFQDLKKLDEEEADCTQEYSSDFNVPSGIILKLFSFAKN